MRPLVLAGLLSLLGVSSSPALESKINLSGHCWETGGFPPSVPGEELQAVGVINGIQNPLFWSPTVYSYTWYLHGLTASVSTVFGTTVVTEYTGGELTIHVDSLPSNHEYGMYPFNATVPGSFTDGHAIYLAGKLQSCTMSYNSATASGALAGELTFFGGNAFPQLESPNGWTIGSTIAGTSPAGYGGALNGALYVDGPTGVSPSTWAQVKGLYR